MGRGKTGVTIGGPSRLSQEWPFKGKHWGSRELKFYIFKTVMKLCGMLEVALKGCQTLVVHQLYSQ